MIAESKIKEFYLGKVIFVTGATGFLGKSLIEKLLRSCDGIERIFILVRNKKTKTAKERAERYLSNPIFEFNGIKNSEICHKIEPIFGDILLPDLGINNEDRQRLIQSVNVVIHLAAMVKLNAPLRYAVQRNLKPIPQLIKLCHQMERFNCVVYSSTIALLNGTGSDAELVRKFHTLSPELIIQSCDYCSDEEFDKMRKTHFQEYNNTYCITKALAEQLLLQESTRLNIAIVRPSGILPAYNEPVPGWVQGLQIVNTGLLIGLGVLQVLPFLKSGAQCVIPVDFVVNAIISSAWFVSNQKQYNLQVFHLTTKSDQNSISIKQLLNGMKINSTIYPSKRAIRCPSITFTRNDYQFKIQNLFKHWIFAYFIDTVLKLTGRKPKLVSIIQAMNDNFGDLQTFINTSPEYELKNTFKLIEVMSVSDRNEFDFDVRNIDWNSYVRHVWLGIRRNLLREKDKHLDMARKKYESLVFWTWILKIILIMPLILLLAYFWLCV